MTTYWLIGEKQTGGSVQPANASSLPATAAVTTVATFAATLDPAIPMIEQSRGEQTEQRDQRTCQATKSKTQEQNRRGAQREAEEHQRGQSKQSSPQIRKQRDGRAQSRSGVNDDESGISDGVGANNGADSCGNVSSGFSIGNGLAVRNSTPASGPLVDGSPSSRSRRSYQAGDSVPNHTETGPSTPLLVPAAPIPRV